MVESEAEAGHQSTPSLHEVLATEQKNQNDTSMLRKLAILSAQPASIDKDFRENQAIDDTSLDMRIARSWTLKEISDRDLQLGTAFQLISRMYGGMEAARIPLDKLSWKDPRLGSAARMLWLQPVVGDLSVDQQPKLPVLVIPDSEAASPKSDPSQQFISLLNQVCASGGAIRRATPRFFDVGGRASTKVLNIFIQAFSKCAERLLDSAKLVVNTLAADGCSSIQWAILQGGNILRAHEKQHQKVHEVGPPPPQVSLTDQAEIEFMMLHWSLQLAAAYRSAVSPNASASGSGSGSGSSSSSGSGSGSGSDRGFMSNGRPSYQLHVEINRCIALLRSQWALGDAIGMKLPMPAPPVIAIAKTKGAASEATSDDDQACNLAMQKQRDKVQAASALRYAGGVQLQREWASLEGMDMHYHVLQCSVQIEDAVPNAASTLRYLKAAHQLRAELLATPVSESQNNEFDWIAQLILDAGRGVYERTRMDAFCGRILMEAEVDIQGIAKRLPWVEGIRHSMFGAQDKSQHESDAGTAATRNAHSHAAGAGNDPVASPVFEVPSLHAFGAKAQLELGIIAELLGRTRGRMNASHGRELSVSAVKIMNILSSRVLAELELTPTCRGIFGTLQILRRGTGAKPPPGGFPKEVQEVSRFVASAATGPWRSEGPLPHHVRHALLSTIGKALTRVDPNQIHSSVHTVLHLLSFACPELGPIRFSDGGELEVTLRPIRKDRAFGLLPLGDARTGVFVALDAWYEAGQVLASFLPLYPVLGDASRHIRKESYDRATMHTCTAGWLLQELGSALPYATRIFQGGERQIPKVIPPPMRGSLQRCLSPLAGVCSRDFQLKSTIETETRSGAQSWDDLVKLYLVSRIVFDPFSDHRPASSLRLDLARRAFIPSLVNALDALHQCSQLVGGTSECDTAVQIMLAGARSAFFRDAAGTEGDMDEASTLARDTAFAGLGVFLGNVMLRLRAAAERVVPQTIATCGSSNRMIRTVGSVSASSQSRFVTSGMTHWLDRRIDPISGLSESQQVLDGELQHTDATPPANSRAGSRADETGDTTPSTSQERSDAPADDTHQRDRSPQGVAYWLYPDVETWVVMTKLDAEQIRSQGIPAELPAQERWLECSLSDYSIWKIPDRLFAVTSRFREACSELPLSYLHTTDCEIIESMLGCSSQRRPPTLSRNAGVEQLRSSVEAEDWCRARHAVFALAGRIEVGRLWLEMVRAANSPYEAISAIIRRPSAICSDFTLNSFQIFGGDVVDTIIKQLTGTATEAKDKHAGQVHRIDALGEASVMLRRAMEARAVPSRLAGSIEVAVRRGLGKQLAIALAQAHFYAWLIQLNSSSPLGDNAYCSPDLFRCRETANRAGFRLDWYQLCGPPMPPMLFPAVECRAAAPPHVYKGEGAKVKVGAAWNVFDGEELLEYSIRSVMEVTHYRVAIYQTTSYFGSRCSSTLLKTLKGLVEAGLLHEIHEYDAKRNIEPSEKRRMTSIKATSMDLGGARPEQVGYQFIHEVNKRELGRQLCLQNCCDVYMSMDCDECYEAESLRRACEHMVENMYDGVVCKMRHYIRHPTWELRPVDEWSYVSALWRLSPHLPCRLGCPMSVSVDPTRRLEHATKILCLQSSQLEMHHFTLVRDNIEMKLGNVSNRSNYLAPRTRTTKDRTDGAQVVQAFVDNFSKWNPRDFPLVHPHPGSALKYSAIAVVPNLFDIQMESCKSCPELPYGSTYTTIPQTSGGMKGIDGRYYAVHAENPGDRRGAAAAGGGASSAAVGSGGRAPTGPGSEQGQQVEQVEQGEQVAADAAAASGGGGGKTPQTVPDQTVTDGDRGTDTNTNGGKNLAKAIKRTEKLLHQFASTFVSQVTAKQQSGATTSTLISGGLQLPEVGSQASAKHRSAAADVESDTPGEVDEEEARAALGRLAAIGAVGGLSADGGAGGTAADTTWAGRARIRGSARNGAGIALSSAGEGASPAPDTNAAAAAGSLASPFGPLDHGVSAARIEGISVTGLGLGQGLGLVEMSSPSGSTNTSMSRHLISGGVGVHRRSESGDLADVIAGRGAVGRLEALSGEDGEEGRRLIQEGLEALDGDGLGLD